MYSQETISHLARAVASHTGRDYDELMREAEVRHPHAGYGRGEAAALVLIGRLTASLLQPPYCIEREACCAAVVEPVDADPQLFTKAT